MSVDPHRIFQTLNRMYEGYFTNILFIQKFEENDKTFEFKKHVSTETSVVIFS